MGFNNDIILVCNVLVDISLIEYKLCKYRSSLIGICAIELSHKIVEGKKKIVR
jgi:hypothetical protein